MRGPEVPITYGWQLGIDAPLIAVGFEDAAAVERQLGLIERDAVEQVSTCDGALVHERPLRCEERRVQAGSTCHLRGKGMLCRRMNKYVVAGEWLCSQMSEA